MNGYARSMTGILTGGLLMVAASMAAATPQGPLVLQPISSGFVFTPEVRFTEVNHSYGTMFGGSGGWLYDESLFFGGAFYGLVGGGRDSQLYYGGFVTGWSTPVGKAVRLGVRGLFGWGHSETYENYTDPGYCHHGSCYGPSTQQAWVYQDFWIFEPQGTATFKLGKKLALDVGGGYRLTGNNYYGWDNNVNGAFGSVGLRLGVF